MNATQSNLCTFLVTEKSYMTVEYGFAFAKNSSLTEVFNKAYYQFLLKATSKSLQLDDISDLG